MHSLNTRRGLGLAAVLLLLSPYVNLPRIL